MRRTFFATLLLALVPVRAASQDTNIECAAIWLSFR